MWLSTFSVPTIGASMPERDQIEPRTSQVELRIEAVRLEPSEKDVWDKISSLSTFLSGIIVALIGFYATNVYNARQQESLNAQKDRELAVLRVQTAAEFFPHLASNNQAIRLAALDSIIALGDEKLAASLAARFGGEAGVSTLTNLTASSDPVVSELASKSLDNIFLRLRSSVIQFRSGSGAIFSSGFFVSSDGLALVPSFGIGDPPYEVATPDGGDFETASLVEVSKDGNLALIRVRISKPAIALEVEPVTAGVGETVIALGSTGSHNWNEITGTVTSVSETELRTTLPSRPGMAGAPILNTRSQVVGMSIGRDESGNVGEPSTSIYRFLQAAAIKSN
jgi:hypothetical protein